MNGRVDMFWKAIQIIAWVIAATAFYFNNSAALSERIAVAEVKIEHETKGVSQRLDRLEGKIDRLMESRGVK